MMNKPTRREFLKTSFVAGGMTALMPFGLASAQNAATPVSMAIARWNGAAPEDNKAAADKLTVAAIAALGGMNRFVSKGANVWIKPNIGWNRSPEQAANTNPQVVAAIARMCFEAGAKTVKVGDHTCNDARQTYVTSGIEEAAKAVGAEMVYLDKNRFKDAAVGGQILSSWPLYPEIIESDLVINVPIVKHHSLATATVCMKNYMGVAGGERGAWHQNLPNCLADITTYMKPQLCVVDATRILTANGPTGGRLEDVKTLNTVAAGTDIVALDAFGAELLGHQPEAIETIKLAAERGLGQMDYKKLSPKETVVS